MSGSVTIGMNMVWVMYNYKSTTMTRNLDTPLQTVTTGITDERTKERIHDHLTDINDIITEDDIRNVITEIPEIDSLPPSED